MRVYQAPTWNENEAVFFAFVVVDAVIRDVVTAVLWSSVSESSGGGGRRRCERIKADRALTVFTDEHSKIMAEYVSQPTQQQMLIVLLFCLYSLLTNYLEQRSRMLLTLQQRTHRLMATLVITRHFNSLPQLRRQEPSCSSS